MNHNYYLSLNGPRAKPALFEFDSQPWYMYPIATAVIAEQLERWAVKEARRNVEKLRPQPPEEGDEPNENEAIDWQIYEDDKRALQTAIQLGLYGAFSPRWEGIVNGTDAGFAEALYLSVRYQNPKWSRQHVRRILASKDDYEVIAKIYYELNNPKAPSPTPTPGPGAEKVSVVENAG